MKNYHAIIIGFYIPFLGHLTSLSSRFLSRLLCLDLFAKALRQMKSKTYKMIFFINCAF
jgi:hypothetical protein